MLSLTYPANFIIFFFHSVASVVVIIVLLFCFIIIIFSFNFRRVSDFSACKLCNFGIVTKRRQRSYLRSCFSGCGHGGRDLFGAIDCGPLGENIMFAHMVRVCVCVHAMSVQTAQLHREIM